MASLRSRPTRTTSSLEAARARLRRAIHADSLAATVTEGVRDRRVTGSASAEPRCGRTTAVTSPPLPALTAAPVSSTAATTRLSLARCDRCRRRLLTATAIAAHTAVASTTATTTPAVAAPLRPDAARDAAGLAAALSPPGSDAVAVAVAERLLLTPAAADADADDCSGGDGDDDDDSCAGGRDRDRDAD